MNADIFKFYRYTQVSLTDAIINYQFGQNGHKLISSAAEYYDRPVVSTEIYGAFKENIFDSMMLYRPMIEMFVRGVNFVIPHGMWYNPEQVYIPPLVSLYSETLKPALPAYSEFVGRACLLLQGGRRVSDIGVLYPFEELAGYLQFDNPLNIRQGFYVSPETDYQEISGILSNDIRRDFTFVHPEFFLEDKYQIEEGKVKLFYESGGTVIFTTVLPYKSSEMGEDKRVIDLIQEIFAVNTLEQSTSRICENSNPNGGYSVYIPNPEKGIIQSILDQHMNPDISFSPNPELTSDFGKFSYIHKVKENREIFYFANSIDDAIESNVVIRGSHNFEMWNRHTGRIEKNVQVDHIRESGESFTRFTLLLDPVKSVFYLGKN